jgi:glycosyltransferase involved in cell wall biosynthesis
VRRSIGLYNLHMQSKGGGEKLTLALAEHLSLRHEVWLFHADPLDTVSLEQYFGLDLSRVRVSPLEGPRLPLRALAKVRGVRPPSFSLQHYLQLRKLNLDIFINNSYASGLVCPAPRGVVMCMFPYSPAPPVPARSLPRRAKDGMVDWLEKRVTGYDVRKVADSYSTVVAISRYSAEWVRRMWGRRADVIYPPCDDMGPCAAKEALILHVGRFVADSGEAARHHKSQGVLLKTFKGLKELHQGGWELHFVGSVGGDEESGRFANSLVQSARGYPVKFHFNAGLADLRGLYRRAAVYWHATGYGFPAEEYPARQEHFGISTVEAMSAGAVPVVYGSGGQREVVTHGSDGFCWDDPTGLAAHTLALVKDRALRERLGLRAVASSRRFGREVFAANVDRLVELLHDGDPPLKGL